MRGDKQLLFDRTFPLLDPADPIDATLGKDALAAVVRSHLALAKGYRLDAATDPRRRHGRARLRAWQAARLAHTHADLLASRDCGRAATFFLSDLYGPRDVSLRDQEVERVLPTLTAVLPHAGVQTLALALAVDALSEQLDAAMVQELQRQERIDDIDADAYATAYRAATERRSRSRQLDLIFEVGAALDRLARVPLLSGALGLMGLPAHAVGLGQLFDFLENGLAAFRAMESGAAFLATLERRERAILDRLFAGDPHPFEIDRARASADREEP